MARTIGIRHRVKATAEGESRPTQVVILDQDGNKLSTYDLADEQAELDFLLGKFPTAFRKLQASEELGNDVPNWHLKFRKPKKGEGNLPGLIFRVVDGEERIVTHVASEFDGLQPGDQVAMVLGGSGDYFAYALTRRGIELGAWVYRIPPSKLKELRGEDKKEDDASLLARSYLASPELFYETRPRDSESILIREAQRARIEAMKARIACEQRLHQVVIGQIFCNPDGRFPEGSIEKYYDEARANDPILKALVAEENRRKRALEKAIERSALWTNVLSEVTGCGPAIAGRIVAAVIDIRRFPSKEAFKAFAGVHVLKDGKFVRKRRSQVSNWHPDFRQALFLLGDQFNRRAESYWGEKLRENKAKLRAKHPEMLVVEGKKRYTDGHIHNMAIWRTLTQFAMWLYREWKSHETSPGNFRLEPLYPKPEETPLANAA
jgi:transposase